MKNVLLARLLCVCAGGLDTATGLGLVFCPALTLRLMGAEPAAQTEDVFLRFVGAFVAAVGCSYLWALARGGAERLRGVLEFTVLFRFSAGVFSAWAIGTHQLSSAWWPVPATDLLLVVLQLALLRRLSLLSS